MADKYGVVMIARSLILTLLAFWMMVPTSPSKSYDEHPPITIAGTRIPDLFEKDADGPYKALYASIEAASSAELALAILPNNRALNNFRNGRADCLYTGIHHPDNFIGKGVRNGEYIISEMINVLELKVYTQDPQPIFEDFDAMKGKIFSGTRALIQVIRQSMPERSKHIRFAEVELLDDAFQLAEIEKVAGVLGISSNVQILQRDRNAGPGFRASETFTLRTSEETIVCHNTPRNKTFLDEIDIKILELRGNGMLREMFPGAG